MAKQELDWDRALAHTQEMMNAARELPGGTGLFYVMGCKQLLKRFLDGERTTALYEEMTKLG